MTPEDRISQTEDEIASRIKTMKVCAVQGRNSDEVLYFLQMLGLIDDFGRVVDQEYSPKNIPIFNGQIKGDRR